MADEEEVFAVGTLAKKLLKIFESCFGGERGGVENLRFVAGLGADEGCSLKAALEGARNDEVELDVQRVEHVSELEAVLLTFLVEGAFGVEEWIRAPQAGAGVAKNIQIHNLFIFYRRCVSGWYLRGECAVRCWGLGGWFGFVVEDSGIGLVEGWRSGFGVGDGFVYFGSGGVIRGELDAMFWMKGICGVDYSGDVKDWL